MGITALEDGLFVNLLIFDYLCTYIYKCPRMSQYKLLYGERVRRGCGERSGEKEERGEGREERERVGRERE